MKLIKTILILILINSVSYSQKTSTVTFNVEMSENFLFHPDYDTLFIAGSFNEWALPGTDLDLMLTDLDENWIYSVQMNLPVGDYEYKYYLNSGWNCGEWTGGSNRIFTVEEGGQNIVLDDYFGMAPGATPFPITIWINDFYPISNASFILGRYEEQQTDENGFVFYSSCCRGCHVPYEVNVEGYDTISGFFEYIDGSHNFLNIDMNSVDISKLNNSHIKIETINNQLIINSDQEYNLNIYNILGKHVYNNIIKEGTTNIITTNLQSGIYIIKFENKNEKYVQKVIIN